MYAMTADDAKPFREGRRDSEYPERLVAKGDVREAAATVAGIPGHLKPACSVRL